MSELVVRDDELAPVSAQLAPIGDPRAFVASYVAVADHLAEIIRAKRLSVSIKGRDHVRVEGWTLLGSMLGAFPVTVWSRPLDDEHRRGWEARVEVRTRDGSLVGAAEAECLREESRWADRDDYALRSMAQTRATSKAMRQPLGFVMTLAGFDPTPAEEMPRDRPGAGASTAARGAGATGDVNESAHPAGVVAGAPAPCRHAVVAEEDGEGVERRCASCGVRMATKPQLVLLNVLYGQLTRDAEYRKPGIISSAGGGPDDDWKAARDRLTFEAAGDVIDRLQRVQARFEAEARANLLVEGTPIA